MPEKTEGAAEHQGAGEGAAGRANQQQDDGDKKPRRGHGEKALASIRAAKRGQREVSDPADRARFLLAEAEVLALLDLADALADGKLQVGAGDTASGE